MAEKTARLQLLHIHGSVLFVTDDQPAMRPLVRVLELEGYRVFVATTGMEAHDRLPAIPRPTLVLVDVRRQLLTGRDFYDMLQPGVAFAPVPLFADDGEDDPTNYSRKTRVDHIDSLLKTVEKFLK